MLHHIVVHTGIEFLDIHLQAIGGALTVCHHVVQSGFCFVDATPPDRLIGVFDVGLLNDWLYHLQQRMMYYSVRVVWQPVDDALFAALDARCDRVWSRIEGFVFEGIVKRIDALGQVLVEALYIAVVALSAPRLAVRFEKVLFVYDFFKKVAISFHSIAFVSPERSRELPAHSGL